MGSSPENLLLKHTYSPPFIEDKEEEWNRLGELGCQASYTEVGSSPPPRSRSASPRTGNLVAVEHTPPKGEDQYCSQSVTPNIFCLLHFSFRKIHA